MTPFDEVAKLMAYVNSYLLKLQPTADVKPFSLMFWSRCLCFKTCWKIFRHNFSPLRGGESLVR